MPHMRNDALGLLTLLSLNIISDNSVKIVQSFLSKRDIQIISFSRNFGKESAIYAGLKNCKGDAAIILDADFLLWL